MVNGPHLFFRLQMLKAFLTHSTGLKNQLLQELLTNATVEAIFHRAVIVMLSQYGLTSLGVVIGKFQG